MVIEVPDSFVRKMMLWRELYDKNVGELTGRGLFYLFAPTPLPIFPEFNHCIIVKYVAIGDVMSQWPTAKPLITPEGTISILKFPMDVFLNMLLFISICFKVNESSVSSFFLIGFDL